jgi:hypothetical protein
MILYPKTLSVHITNAVAGNYGELTQFDLFDAEILDIKRQTEGGFSFTVKVQISPFKGAHNTIGKDTITLEVTPGMVTVISMSIGSFKSQMAKYDTP